MKQYNFIFWDFDGTIVDTTQGTRKSAKHTLKHFGIEENEKDLGRMFCGPPLKESLKKFGIKDEEIDKAISIYRKYQAENTIEINKVYNGIVDVLKELKKRNKTLVVVTLKSRETAIEILKHEGIYEYFTSVYGATEKNPQMTKTELLEVALKQIKNVKTEECIMIGDRSSDILAGRINNLDTIGVLYGMDSLENLKKAEATFLVKNPLEILDIVK